MVSSTLLVAGIAPIIDQGCTIHVVYSRGAFEIFSFVRHFSVLCCIRIPGDPPPLVNELRQIESDGNFVLGSINVMKPASKYLEMVSDILDDSYREHVC